MDPWNDNPKKSPWGDNKNQSVPDIEELLTNLQNKFKFKGGGGGQKSFGALMAVVALVVWLATGFFIVDPEEEGVIRRFGVVQGVVGPGPHYHFPAPIETVQVEPVTKVRRIEVGFRTISPPGQQPAKYRLVRKEALMLTGDENIIDVQFTVQYRIANLENYLFNLANSDVTVKAAAESAMREVVGDTGVMAALTEGKGLIESTTALLLQKTLNSYRSGIRIENVKLQDVHPPEQVRGAFKDVVSAREDKEKMIKEADGYRNNLIPRARGEAVQVVNQAKAYAEQVVNLARGRSDRFISIYEEYKNAKEVTRERILLETMEEILPKVNKVIADTEMSKNMLPFLPLNQLQQAAEPKKP